MCVHEYIYRCNHTVPTKTACLNSPGRRNSAVTSPGSASISGTPSLARASCPGGFTRQVCKVDCLTCQARAALVGTETSNTPGDVSDAAELLEMLKVHGSTQDDDVPSLRFSQSTCTDSTIMPLRCSTDFEGIAADGPRVFQITSLEFGALETVASEAELATDAIHDEAGIYPRPMPKVPPPSSMNHDKEADKQSSWTGTSSSIHGRHLYRLAGIFGWKQTISSQQQYHLPKPRSIIVPDKRVKRRRNAVLSRKKSVDSDESFICSSALEIENSGTN